MSTILVINAGSSSIKYQLIETEDATRIATGLVERIGEPSGALVHEWNGEKISKELTVPDHAAAFRDIELIFAASGMPLDSFELQGVGHRVVQGGEHFISPTIITDEVADQILALSPLAPLHNPAEHQAILAAQKIFAHIPHVAVFDTAFHQTIPPRAYTYAIDAELARKRGVRRYGFHGTSHRNVSRRAAEFAGLDLESSKQIVLHLGNGASACAVRDGRSIDTSMGLTPLEGLVMGTRSGNLDPSILFYLANQADLSLDELDTLLNKKSGLLGLAGSNDVRDVTQMANAGDPQAMLALEVYAYRIRGYIGQYVAQLGGLDVLTFTAGVGENSAKVREMVCDGLEVFGIELSHDANWERRSDVRCISRSHTPVKVLVVPTDEELEIARQVDAVTA
jgi:acetate kinase